VVAVVSLALSLLTTVAVIAIAWGVFSTRVKHLEDGLKDAQEANTLALDKAVVRVERLEGHQSDTAVRLARIEEQQAQSIRLLEEMKALLTPKRRR
jgi:hypothetical protein